MTGGNGRQKFSCRKLPVSIRLFDESHVGAFPALPSCAVSMSHVVLLLYVCKFLLARRTRAGAASSLGRLRPLEPSAAPAARALSLCACKEGKHGGRISSALYPCPEIACCSFSQCKVFCVRAPMRMRSKRGRPQNQTRASNANRGGFASVEIEEFEELPFLFFFSFSFLSF